MLNHKHLVEDGFQILFLLYICINWFKKLLLYWNINNSFSLLFSSFSYFCKISGLSLNKKFFFFNILVPLVGTSMTIVMAISQVIWRMTVAMSNKLKLPDVAKCGNNVIWSDWRQNIIILIMTTKWWKQHQEYQSGLPF